MIRRVAAPIAIVVAAVSLYASPLQQLRLSEITVAHNVSWGRPVDPATVLAPDAGEIFVWARLEGAADGTVIHAEWFYLGGAAPRSVATDDVKATAASTNVQFSFALPEGRRWPEGGYRVELSTAGRVLGEARFTIAAGPSRPPAPAVDTPRPAAPTRPADPASSAPAAQRFTHPRVGYSFAPPAGWALDTDGADDGVRLRLENGAGLIEIATGVVGVRMDPVSYAAGWQSVAVGPGKLLVQKRSGRPWTLAGEKSYEAVYAGPGVMSKIVFAATADRMFVITASFGTDAFATSEVIFDKLLLGFAFTSRVVPADPTPTAAPSVYSVNPPPARPAGQAAPAPSARSVDFSGYAEWRHGDALIVDGQRVVWSPAAKFKGDKKATSFATIPLGYEVSGKGVRLPDGRIEATELEVKPNGVAVFEKDVKQSMTDVESTWIQAGKAFDSTSDGKTHDIGKLHTSGPEVDRIRRLATRLTPGYLNATDFRTYVVENKDWNAFAAPNGMIVVYDSLLKATDDDEMAIVLGHELVHATHEHSRKEFKSGMWLQLLALGVVAGAEGIDSKKARQVVQLAALFTATAMRSGYSRNAEDQADRVGLRYVYEAGFDVQKGPALWNRFAQKYGDDNVVVNFFFGDHSRSSARAKNLSAEIALNYSGR